MLKIGGGAVLVAAIVAVFVVATQGRDPDLEALEQEGKQYILENDKGAGLRKNRASLAEWSYTSNLTKDNEEKKVSIHNCLYYVDVVESNCNNPLGEKKVSVSDYLIVSKYN